MNTFLINSFQKERQEFENTTQRLYDTHHFPDDVIEIRNVRYGTDNLPEHRMDVYRPADTQRIYPVIINVHGGGLVMGSKEFNRFFCAELCKLGYVVFNIEYRLVPEVQVYHQFSDVSAAMDYISDSIMVYGGDPSRVYMVGDSAGAYLIVYTVAMQKSSVLAAAAKVEPSQLKIRALGLISGMYYTRRFDKIGLFLPKIFYGKDYKHSAFFPYTNPEHPEIVKNLPPCFLITSHSDHLRRYTLDFGVALRRNGTECELMDFGEGEHLTHAFGVFDPDMKESQEVLCSIASFFNNH